MFSRTTLIGVSCAALAAITFDQTQAQERKPPSIESTPPVSEAALSRVREERRGQYAVPNGFQSGMIDSEGIHLHYVSGGSGPPIVFVHGFGSTWKEWVPALLAFRAKLRVVAIDTNRNTSALSLLTGWPHASGRAT